MQIKYGNGPCDTQQNDRTFPAKHDLSHRFQLQHLAMTRDAKEPEDAAINLKLLGRLGHNAVGKKHYCLSQCFSPPIVDTRKQRDEKCLTNFPDVFVPFITQNLDVKHLMGRCAAYVALSSPYGGF